MIWNLFCPELSQSTWANCQDATTDWQVVMAIFSVKVIWSMEEPKQEIGNTCSTLEISFPGAVCLHYFLILDWNPISF